jgi:Flp pilus assembly protein TadG
MATPPLSDVRSAAKPTFLARLRSDVAGNALMIVAGAIIPLTAMIGAGVDTSRSYLVKARLQQACDSGALAARKFMGGGGLTDDVKSKAQAYFGNNFPTGTLGTSNTSFVTGLNEEGQVTGSASARVPMTVMTLFGNQFSDVTARCDAKLEISNTDIMFVLDITGSMACAPEDTSTQCTNYINSGGGFSSGKYIEKTNSRMKGLREAVVAFYDELDSAVADTSILRYGIVPYSSGVNLGSTSMTGGILKPEWIVDNWSYQSRDANMTQEDTIVSTPVDTTEVYSNGTGISSANCTQYGRNNFPSAGNAITTVGTPPAKTTTTSYTNNASAGVDFGYPGAADTNGTNQSCRRKKSVFTTTYTGLFEFKDWTYQQSSLNVSMLKIGGTISLATGNGGTVTTAGTYTLSALAAATTGGNNTTISWKGCVEERDTVGTDDFSPIPSGAKDLDIDSVPTNDSTRWRPSVPEMIFDRTDPNDQVTTANNYQPTQLNTAHSCNKRAWKLGVRSRSEVYDYVYGADFLPHGGTYHDIGMIWGARLISPTGIFASENATAPNGKPIDRHIIFMTDGDMSPSTGSYSAYGYEKLDRRVSGSGNVPDTATLKTRHNSRFNAICDSVRDKKIKVWVVAFSQSLTPELTACADPNQAFTSGSTTDLIAKFRLIAGRIAELRLSK